MTQARALASQVVHVIDDDTGLREGLARLLISAGVPVAPFASPEAFLAAVRPDDRGCLLLDIRLPGMNGLDLQARLLGSGITLPVIIMTGHADVASTLRGMKAGAIDFLIKPIDETDLLAAIALAFEADRQRASASALAQEASERFSQLTVRERQVLGLVTDGLMNKQVAGALGISQITVKAHRGTMMRKMNVLTLADLVRVAEVLKQHQPWPPH